MHPLDLGPPLLYRGKCALERRHALPVKQARAHRDAAPVHTVVKVPQLRVALFDQVDDQVDGGGAELSRSSVGRS